MNLFGKVLDIVGLIVGLVFLPFQDQIPTCFGGGNTNLIDFHHKTRFEVWNQGG
jgi:hypothetical protein